MDSHTLDAHAISEKARAERLYLHYALALATLFAIAGAVMAVLALGDRLDVITRGNGMWDVRLLNAAPGFALCLAAAALFAASKPRQPRAQPAPTQADDLEQRIERAVSSRLGVQSAVSVRTVGAGRTPASLMHHMAESLADALQQSALDALPALRKARETPTEQDRVKPRDPLSGDT
jgi:hypothetical protein